MSQPQASFSQNSLFASTGKPTNNVAMQRYADMVAAGRSRPHLNIDNVKREDWAHRLRSMADEAGDADLLSLESDLLDLQDEILLD